MRKLAPLLALTVLAVGCGGSKHLTAAPPVTGKQWKAVVNDWLNNGRLDTRHSCGAVIDAVAHLEAVPTASPTATLSYAITALDRYAGTVCPRAPRLSDIKLGMSDTDVANLAGMPHTVTSSCWLYPPTQTHDGRSVCFERGRVTLVQTDTHL